MLSAWRQSTCLRPFRAKAKGPEMHNIDPARGEIVHTSMGRDPEPVFYGGWCCYVTYQRTILLFILCKEDRTFLCFNDSRLEFHSAMWFRVLLVHPALVSPLTGLHTR